MQFDIIEKCNTVLHLFYSATIKIAKIAGKLLFMWGDTGIKWWVFAILLFVWRNGCNNNKMVFQVEYTSLNLHSSKVCLKA